MGQHDVLTCRELHVADKFSFMPALTPTAAQTGWAITNKAGTPRDLDCDAALAVIMDRFGQLVDDLIAKGILSA